MALPPGFVEDSMPTSANSKLPQGFSEDNPNWPASTLDKAKLVYKMAGAAPTPTSLIKEKVLEPTGEKIAELGGTTKFPGISKSISQPVSAAIGTVVSEAPAFLSAATTLGGLYNETDPTLAAKAIRNSPKMLGKQYQFQDEAAGIGNELPVRSGKLPGFEKTSADIGDAETAKNMSLNPPVSYPKDTNAFLNFARARMSAFGEDLTPDELTHYKDSSNALIKLGENRVNTLAQNGKAYAMANQMNKQAGTLQAKVVNSALVGKKIPEGYQRSREDLNRLYAWSKRMRIAPVVAEKIWKYLGPKFRWGEILVP